MLDWEQQNKGKTCLRCGKGGLTWDKEFHTKTGKWKLENHKRDDGKWCNKPPEIMMVRTIDECQFCPLCAGSSFGLIKSKNPKDLELHMTNIHPNGEIKTDLDFRMEMGMHPLFLKYWSNDIHFFKYRHMIE